jgi:hypothetical protein
MRALAQQFQVEFTPRFIADLSNGAANLTGNIAQIASTNPSLLMAPVSWTEINLADLTPTNSFVTFAGLSIGLIMVMIFTYAAILVCYCPPNIIFKDYCRHH